MEVQVILHAAPHDVEHCVVHAPHWNPQVFTHDVHCEEHASLHKDVQEELMQFILQFDSHAPWDSIPQMDLHPHPIQFPLQSF